MMHIRKGARVVAVLLAISTAINIVFSLTRTSTVAVYTLMTDRWTRLHAFLHFSTPAHPYPAVGPVSRCFPTFRRRRTRH
ncbi:hypothetical protein Y032_0069g287 [Ancylostoma ceylanicum]|nr:hypothetical protein Y032_0069g287 [Ancylostoma ceylanicum]